MDPKADVSCVDCLNGLFFCFGPFHQFDRYYKDGHLDDCSSKFRDLRFCMRLKLADTENTKTLVRELIADRKSPTEGSVWQRRLGAAHVQRDSTPVVRVTTPGGVGPVGPG